MGKWTTTERGIQYLRELAMLEVTYDDLDNKQLLKDPDEVKCTQHVWQKFVQSTPSSYANSLAVMTWKGGEGQTADELAGKLQQYKKCLSSSLWACISAVEKLSWEFQQFKEDMSCSPPVQNSISAIRSQCSSAQERGFSGYTPQATLWFYLHDHREDMRKWDGKSASTLEALTGGSQQLTVLEAEVSLTGNEWQKHPIVTGPEAPCIFGIDCLRRGCFKDPKGYRWAFGIAALETEEIKQLSTLPGLSEDLSVVGLLKVKEQQVPIASTTVHWQQYRTNRDSLIPIHKLIC
ncbi:hypothetical protein QYF61_012416 [Mycteria americana]|uniref:Uncharacterized protein n=1 Tax=Mycteria americana TaxID=33587 RepID=A0AAN7RUL4_MYCAM|nr:hypothetical protein QYF61_012416 [Mycteria americana]